MSLLSVIIVSFLVVLGLLGDLLLLLVGCLSSGLGGLFDFLGLCFGGLLLGGSLGLVLLSSLHAFLGSFVLLLFIFDLFLGLFVGLFLLFLLLGGISLGLLSDFLALLCSLLLGTLSLGVLGFLFGFLRLFLRELGLLL